MNLADQEQLHVGRPRHPTTVGDHLLEIKRLNSAGIGSLMAHDGGAAIGFFVRALTIAQNLIPDEVEPNDEAAVVEQEPAQVMFSTPVPGLQDLESFLYIQNQAIWFDERMGTDTTMCATVILFNLALAHHYHGMANQKAKLFQNACRMYNLCATEMVPRWLPRAQQGLQMLLLQESIGMACLNNQAQIQYQFLGNPTAALDLTEQLLRILPNMRVLALQNEDADDQVFSKQCDEVLLNTQVFLNYAYQAAPEA